MTQHSDNGTWQSADRVPGEVRINVLILEVDPSARTASAVVGNADDGNPLDLTFAPDVPEDLGSLAGKRAWVEGPYERGADRLLCHVYVQHVEEGSNWMSVTETLERDKVRAPRKSKIAVEGFDFDLDAFLELIYEGRGRTWSESKLD